MVVPVFGADLDKAKPALHQVPSHQTVIRKAQLIGRGTVLLRDTLRLLARVHQLRHGGLHAKGEFILSNASLGLGFGRWKRFPIGRLLL